ncbi:MAG: sensor histidine kinase [Pirellulales bacterium]
MGLVILFALTAQPTARAITGEADRDANKQKRVLVIDQDGATRPAFVLFMEAFRKGLASGGGGPFDVFVENLELTRLGRDASDLHEAADWLNAKYGDASFDVIVPTSRVCCDLVLASGVAFSQHVSVVGVERPGEQPVSDALQKRYVSVSAESQVAATIEIASRLFPRSGRVALIGQSSPHPSYAEYVVEDARASAERLRLEFVSLVDLRFDEVLAAVRDLPADSLVIYVGYWGDETTGAAVPAEALEDVCQESRAPVFGVAETYVGRGIVGGAVTDMAAMGEQAGRLAAAISRGPLPEPVQVPVVATFDARALKRFGVPRSRLPADAQVLFETLTFWQRYWLQMLLTGLVVVVQAGLITALVVNLRRRVAAERMVSTQRDQMIHAGRVSTLGEFAASLAHELSQPLGAILNNVEVAGMLLGKEALGAGDLTELREIVKDIAADEQRAGEVLERIRSMVRKQRFTPAKLTPLELLKGVQALARPRCAAESITLGIECEADLPNIAGDRILLQQALLNLVGNACDAICQTSTPRQTGMIVLRGREVSGWVELSVVDDGGGIIDGSVERAREPFHTTKEDGLGVGLAIVQSIMEQHDGRFDLENNTGRGVTARLLVPTIHEGRS